MWKSVFSFGQMGGGERFRPNPAASALTAELSELATISAYSEGFGSQTTTKSPPGPNLQSGSVCLSLSGFIFFSGFQLFVEFIQSQMFYRQGTSIYPNKNRTKLSLIRTFFLTLNFYSDSYKNMGLHMKKIYHRSN